MMIKESKKGNTKESYFFIRQGEKANPSSFVTKKYLDSQEHKPGMRPNLFKRLHKNLWISEEESFISDQDYRNCIDYNLKRRPENKIPVWLGLDVGISNDYTAIGGVGKINNKIFLVDHKIYIPLKTEELQFHQQNFLMAVTHELKTPLAAIEIYLDSLKSEKIPPEKKLEIIPKMKDDVKRLEKMVENILDAGRFDRQGYKLNKSDFDFSILLNDIINEFDKILLSTKFVISRNIQEKLELFGDPSALRRAIESIIENSFKYNDKKQININVELSENRDKYHLKIKDNGIGIDKKDLNEIFKRFYRVGDELRRNKPGSGLGLYLSREIIHAHHGEISAHSDGIGKGTTFIIKIDKKNNGSN